MPEASYIVRLVDKFSSPLAGIEGKMNHFESSLNSLGNTIVTVFAADKLLDFATAAFDVTREFTNMRDAITFASGENATRNLQFLDDEINRLGLDVMSTYKGFKTFQGALMGTSLEGEKGLEIFKAVSEAATVMKLSADQTEGTFLALGQMISKGNVQAEELRGQLGERLPGAFQIFARALGVSTKKLNKMLQDGEVIAEDTLPLFAQELRKTFSPGVLSSQQSFNSNWNRFKNFLTDIKLTIGNQIIPIMNEWIQLIPQLDFSLLLNPIQALGDQLGGLWDIVKPLFNVFGSDAQDVFHNFATGVAVAAGSVGLLALGVRELIQLMINSVPVIDGFVQALVGGLTQDYGKMALGIAKVESSAAKLTDDFKSMADEWMSGQEKIFNNLFYGSGFKSGKGGATTAGNFAGSMGASGGAKSTGKEAGVEKIQSGTRNVTLNINKLIESVNFTKSPERSEAQLTEFLKRALLTAVNDVNIIAQ